jgi:hypothetical protein
LKCACLDAGSKGLGIETAFDDMLKTNVSASCVWSHALSRVVTFHDVMSVCSNLAWCLSADMEE